VFIPVPLVQRNTGVMAKNKAASFYGPQHILAMEL